MQHYSSVNSYSVENEQFHCLVMKHTNSLKSVFAHKTLFLVKSGKRRINPSFGTTSEKVLLSRLEAWLLDGVQHVEVASICITWDQLVAWWQCCKAQEHECPHQQCCKKKYFNTSVLQVCTKMSLSDYCLWVIL